MHLLVHCFLEYENFMVLCRVNSVDYMVEYYPAPLKKNWFGSIHIRINILMEVYWPTWYSFIGFTLVAIVYKK